MHGQKNIKPYRIDMCYNLYKLHILIYVHFKNFKKIPGKERVNELVFTQIFYSVFEISV